ncbi:hypothetical protein D9M68_627140 [compost metagenome]
MFRRLAGQFAVTVVALGGVALRGQGVYGFGELGLLPGREAQTRIQDLAGEDFRVAGRIGPAVQHDARHLGRMAEVQVLRQRDFLQVRLDADLRPHLHDGARHFVIAGEGVVGRQELDLQRLVGPVPGLGQFRLRGGLVVGVAESGHVAR